VTVLSQSKHEDIMTRTQAILIGLASLATAGFAVAGGLALAAGQYGPGVSDTEIKIGNTMPYSGPASGLGTLGKAEAAYFAMVNDQGGVNGRKINFITRDDGYSPPKTVEIVRHLVEEEQVLLMFSMLGTATNTAVQGYLNDNKVPQLFIATGAAKWDDPKHHPWTMAFTPNYPLEARIYGRYILKSLPDAKIAVLYQNDDFGKDYLVGLRQGLGDRADKMIIATKSYETTDPTVDSQIVALQASGADVLLTAAVPKFAAQAIRKVFDVGWKPIHFLSFPSSSIGGVMRPAGPEKSIGIISATAFKDATDSQWRNTLEYKDWLAWMQKYNPSASLSDVFNVDGYSRGQAIVSLLKACGDNLTRENVMKQAASMHDLKLPMLLPGITLSTSADDYQPIKQMQLQKFDGNTWQLFGEVISGSGS
jgi:branched-chain amino acid transport system substrate-binding protein